MQRAAVAAVEAGEAKTLTAAVAATKPDPGIAPAQFGRDLDALLEQVPRLATENAAGRELLGNGLRAARALVGRL